MAKSIRQDKNRGEKIWENIDKLRGEMKITQNTDSLYDSDKQVLNEADANSYNEDYWRGIYQKHHKHKVWNDESKQAYQKLHGERKSRRGYCNSWSN